MKTHRLSIFQSFSQSVLTLNWQKTSVMNHHGSWYLQLLGTPWPQAFGATSECELDMVRNGELPRSVFGLFWSAASKPMGFPSNSPLFKPSGHAWRGIPSTPAKFRDLWVCPIYESFLKSQTSHASHVDAIFCWNTYIFWCLSHLKTYGCHFCWSSMLTTPMNI